MTGAADESATLVLVGGHESANGADLEFVKDALDRVVITAAGRPLHNAITRLLAANDDAIVVLPMTFGRNPTFVADVAKTLKWLAIGKEHRIVLADDFGTIDHLTAWLRTAATEVRKSAPDAAVVISAQADNPFDDAELYRIGHLVRTHGAGNEVEVAPADDAADLAEVLNRVQKLGSDEAVVVPAGFQRESPLPFGSGEFAHASFYGPLMSEQAIVRVIRQRTHDALHRLGHGNSGIDTGLMADHGHGYAHSHAFDESQGAGHTHGPGGHSHPHTHEQATLTHTH